MAKNGHQTQKNSSHQSATKSLHAQNSASRQINSGKPLRLSQEWRSLLFEETIGYKENPPSLAQTTFLEHETLERCQRFSKDVESIKRYHKYGAVMRQKKTPNEETTKVGELKVGQEVEHQQER